MTSGISLTFQSGATHCRPDASASGLYISSLSFHDIAAIAVRIIGDFPTDVPGREFPPALKIKHLRKDGRALKRPNGQLSPHRHRDCYDLCIPDTT
jgi:hypothetical protein